MWRRYHLFPEFVGGKDRAAHDKGHEVGARVLEYVMKVRGGSAFIAGELSLADLYLAPIVQYVSMTPDKDELFSAPGFLPVVGRDPGDAELRVDEAGLRPAGRLC